MIRRSFMLLFSRPRDEEPAAEHGVRERRLGRALSDILHDPWRRNFDARGGENDV